MTSGAVYPGFPHAANVHLDPKKKSLPRIARVVLPGGEACTHRERKNIYWTYDLGP